MMTSAILHIIVFFIVGFGLGTLIWLFGYSMGLAAHRRRLPVKRHFGLTPIPDDPGPEIS